MTRPMATAGPGIVRPPRRGERGQIGGIEVLPFGVLIFVAGSLLLANAWAVIDAKLAATAAAREATRAYVEAPDQATAEAAAFRAANDTIAGHGRDPHQLRLNNNDPTFVRCARVVYEAALHRPCTDPAVHRWLRPRVHRGRSPRRDHRPVHQRLAGRRPVRVPMRSGSAPGRPHGARQRAHAHAGGGAGPGRSRSDRRRFRRGLHGPTRPGQRQRKRRPTTLRRTGSTRRRSGPVSATATTRPASSRPSTERWPPAG